MYVLSFTQYPSVQRIFFCDEMHSVRWEIDVLKTTTKNCSPKTCFSCFPFILPLLWISFLFENVFLFPYLCDLFFLYSYLVFVNLVSLIQFILYFSNFLFFERRPEIFNVFPIMCCLFILYTGICVKLSQGHSKPLNTREFILIHRRKDFLCQLMAWLLQWSWGENVFWQFVVDIRWVLLFLDIFFSLWIFLTIFFSGNSYFNVSCTLLTCWHVVDDVWKFVLKVMRSSYEDFTIFEECLIFGGKV